MLKDYLEPKVYELITKSFSFHDITEIRMRKNQKLIVVIKNQKYYLKNDEGEYLIVSSSMLENFIMRATENSIYAYNNNIINGFITLNNGIRIGICGEVVYENNIIKTIKNFQSVNIRIPHIVKNCSLNAYDFIVNNNNILNTLIVSAPGSGKTTFIRDLIFQLYKHNISKNILVCDERNEICFNLNQEEVLSFCDVFSNCSKNFAFKNGIRSMNPDLIITDELDLDSDIACLKEAMNSGVNVIATIHSKDINELKRKRGFDEIINQKFFSRFVVLTDLEGPGTLTNIYDEKFNCLLCRWVWNGY